MDGPSINLKHFTEMFKAIVKSLKYSNLLTLAAVPYTQFMVHSKRELNQRTGKLRKLSKTILSYFTILLLEEVTVVEVTGSTVFPLSFCTTRWFGDKKLAERLISIWPSIVKIVNHWESYPKSKPPSCKSYEFVLNAVKNELSLVRLQFFNYLASMFETFLKLFQTDAPMLPHMNGDLLELIKSIPKIFIKFEAIEACSNLPKIGLHNKEIRLTLSQIDIGFAADESSNSRKKDIFL